MLRRLVSLVQTDVSELRTVYVIRAMNHSFIVLMMEGSHTSVMSVYSNETTWCYIPEDFKLHTRRSKKLKFHKIRFNSFLTLNAYWKYF
jgi:hypothetical protein